MKKRLFVLMMAGLMAFGVSGMSVFAEEEETEVAEETAEAGEYDVVIDWAEYEAEIANYEQWAGDFVSFEQIALKMYVPDTFEAAELTEEDEEAGYIGYYTLSDDFAAAVQYVDMDSMELDEYAELLVSEYDIDENNISSALVNGFPCLIYSFTEDEVETAVLAMATERGYIIEFSFSDVSAEESASVAQVMMASVQEA